MYDIGACAHTGAGAGAGAASSVQSKSAPTSKPNQLKILYKLPFHAVYQIAGDAIIKCSNNIGPDSIRATITLQ